MSQTSSEKVYNKKDVEEFIKERSSTLEDEKNKLFFKKLDEVR